MKKIVLLFVSFCVVATAHAGTKNLYEKFKDKPHVKVYLNEVQNVTNDPRVNVDVFRKVFDETHRKRVNIKFIPVENAEEADVIVNAKIEKYAFQEKAMPSVFGGTSAIVADSLAPKSEANLTVDYDIIDPKHGGVILEHENFTTSERRPVKDMQGEKAFEYAVEKNVNRFIYRSFRKQQPKHPL